MLLYREVCVQPRALAVNVTLPASAAERLAAERRCLQLVRDAGARRCLSISPARSAPSSKPAGTSAAVDLRGRQTDGHTTV